MRNSVGVPTVMMVEHCRFHLYMYYTWAVRCASDASLHLVKQSTENDRRNCVIGCDRLQKIS